MLAMRWLCRQLRAALLPTRVTVRRPAVRLESLEERALLSGLSFQFQIDDPTHQFNAYPLLQSNLQAVGQILAGALDGQGTLQVRVRPNNSLARASGTALAVSLAGYDNGRPIYESVALAAARSGVNPAGTGPEIELDFNARSYLPQLWFDPSGAARSGSVPRDKTDFVSVALHETLHALAFQGYRVISGPNYGQLSGNYESSFDALSAFGSGAATGTLFFHGSHASALYGGPVPLTSVGANDPLTGENFYHVGNPAGHPGAELTTDLMNGVVFNYGTRYSLSGLDLAILADVGWSVLSFAPPTNAPPASLGPTPTVPPAPPVSAPITHRRARHHPHRRSHLTRRIVSPNHAGVRPGHVPPASGPTGP